MPATQTRFILTLTFALFTACGGGGGGGAGGTTSSTTSSTAGSSAAAASASSTFSERSSSASSSTPGNSSSRSSAAGSSAGNTSAPGSSSASSRASSSSSAASSASASASACSASSFMGAGSLLIGAQMEDATAAAAPFDTRYMYLAGGIRAESSCASSCDGSCGQWWGCWQDARLAPGEYVRHHLSRTANARWQGAARPQIATITYYELLHGSGSSEGTPLVASINNAAFLKRYLDDWRFLLQTIGNQAAILHIEPDFWGFARQINSNPALIPATVKVANPTDCASQADNASGFARCMISMARKYAPNARVGLHASPWNYTQSGDAAALASFMNALGAADGDFFVTDPSDRDAGYYSSLGQNRWWTDASASAYLGWHRALSDSIGKPGIVWQIPLGNMAQNNSTHHWQDNRVDWLFTHRNAVAQAGIVALLFGAGQNEQTTPESDGGNLIQQTINYRAAGGTALCR